MMANIPFFLALLLVCTCGAAASDTRYTAVVFANMALIFGACLGRVTVTTIVCWLVWAIKLQAYTAVYILSLALSDTDTFHLFCIYAAFVMAKQICMLYLCRRGRRSCTTALGSLCAMVCVFHGEYTRLQQEVVHRAAMDGKGQHAAIGGVFSK
jgi:fucose 4-O-acetylase-like acetyltransferase